MVQTERQQKLQELEGIIKEKREPSERKGLYEPGKAQDECERRGFPEELWSIMDQQNLKKDKVTANPLIKEDTIFTTVCF